MRIGSTYMRASGALVMSIAALCVATGCGGDDDSDSASTGSAGGAPASTTSDLGDTQASSGVTDLLEYTGGKAGKADSSLSPITIGWVNQQGGPADVSPGATRGAEVAVKYVNEQLGGIGGHPLRLSTCFISTSEEQGQTCGQKMVNDDNVSVVSVGAVAIGAQSLVATIGGDKPMVHGVSVGSADSKNENGYALFGDLLSVSPPFGTYAKEVLKAKSVAIMYPEVPGFAAAATGQANGAKASGITAKKVAWNPTATDLVGPLTAAGAQSADAIITSSDAKGCVNLAKAIKQLGLDTPVLSQPLCLSNDVAKALGDLSQWTYGIASSLPTDTEDPSAVEFMKVAGKYGLAEEAAGDPVIPLAFSQILTIAQWMNKLGADNVTPEAIAEQAKAFKGPLLLGPPTIQCGKYPDRPAICNDQAKFYTYEGKGVFKPASGWLGPAS
jgi:branched-chain amino acid transport system substrate-binding protein